MILAAQLRCQAQFAAVHGAGELGIKAFRGCGVHQASGADLRPRAKAMLVAAAAQFDSILRGCRRRPDPPSTASTRSGWRTFTTRTAPGLGQWGQNSSAKGSSLERWRACTLTLGAGGPCPSGLKSSCCCLPHWPVSKQRQSDHKATRHARRATCVGGWSAAAGPQRLCDQVGSINAELLGAIRYSGRGQRKAFANRLIKKKGNIEHVPFYWIKPPAGLTDWHWAYAGFLLLVEPRQ